MGGINALDEELGFTSDEEIIEMYKTQGRKIEISEIRDRLSSALFEQLRDGSDNTILKAINRSLIHASVVIGKAGKILDLDDVLHREIVLNLTLYELHMALGHEEAGREYRMKAKDLLDASIDSSEAGDEPNVPVAAVTGPTENKKWF